MMDEILFKYFNNFNISNIDKEVNKELPEDDLIEDRNMLECFLKFCMSFVLNCYTFWSTNLYFNREISVKHNSNSIKLL